MCRYPPSFYQSSLKCCLYVELILLTLLILLILLFCCSRGSRWGGGRCWLVEITKAESAVCSAEDVESFNLCHLSREWADLTVNNITLLKNIRGEPKSDAFWNFSPLIQGSKVLNIVLSQKRDALKVLTFLKSDLIWEMCVCYFHYLFHAVCDFLTFSSKRVNILY
jgi:hypothetical protein